MLTWLSRRVFFPLWEIKDGAKRRQYLRELTASQWFPPETLRQAQWARLRAIVAYAFGHSPYYRSTYAGLGFDGMLRNWEEFCSLPLLSKREVRANAERLLSVEFRREDLVEAKTGGSTGTALTLYFDRPCQEMRNAAAMRSDRWAGWDIGMKVAAVWGNPPVADTLKKKVRNVLLDRVFYLDTMDINRESVLRFVTQWRRERARILYGHAHSLYILATFLSRMNVRDLCPTGIIATSMMLLEPERRVIEEVFGCRVTNRYGCEEIGLIACECEKHHGLHLNADHVVVEFLREDGTEAEPGEEGDIVVTDLINRAMPLIRYRIEDLGVPSARHCPCERGLPLIERVTGRRADFLKRPDGSLVAGVSLVERTLTAIQGIQQMQLVQDELTRLRARVVRDVGYGETSERKLHKELRSAFGGNVKIEIEYVRELDRTRAGKYRFAICNVEDSDGVST